MTKSSPGESGRWKRVRLPFFLIVVNLLLGGALVYEYVSLGQQYRDRKATEDALVVPDISMVQVRNHDYSLISPLRLTDVVAEYPGFGNIKTDINLFIQQKKNEGTLMEASVYLRRMDDGSWMSISGNMAFKGGSLLKVATLICYLKNVEDGVLSLRTEFNADFSPERIVPQTFTGKSISPGRKYTLDELLKYLIEESDNNASHVLSVNVDKAGFQKVFTDLGLIKPEEHQTAYTLSAPEYSRFLRVLYNANYLKEKYSLYAMKLLTHTRFNSGLTQPLPANTIVAHKFGEQKDGYDCILSESGIIYQGENTYLLTVMTKGKDIQQLPGIISEISRITYEGMKMVH